MIRVRRAVPGDESILRDLRIQALTDSPHEFGSTLEREVGRTLEDWRRWVSPGTTFLLEHDGVAQGLVAGIQHDANPALAFLMAMWVHPEARGIGGGDLLVRSVQDWATDAGYETLLLHVVKENVHAARLYLRNGFVSTDEVVRDRDGVVEVEMHWKPTLA